MPRSPRLAHKAPVTNCYMHGLQDVYNGATSGRGQGKILHPQTDIFRVLHPFIIYGLWILRTQLRKMPRSLGLARLIKRLSRIAIRTVPRMSTMEPHLADGKGKHVHPRKLPFQFTDGVNFVELFKCPPRIYRQDSACAQALQLRMIKAL